jgi:hypothetical protein
LWGVLYWIEGRVAPAAMALAVASLFHLNHALVALALWLAVWTTGPLRRATPAERLKGVIGFAVVALFGLPNVIPAARLALSGAPKMPLPDFVDLYVRLRHPHHYDPVSWPPALWLSFLWPLPLAVVAYRRLRGREPVRRAALISAFFLALQLLALLFAGIVFVSEPLIQMSLFRFSIYPKLLACVGAAAVLCDAAFMARRAARYAVLAMPLIVLAVVVVMRLSTPGSAAGAFVRSNLTPLLLFCALLAAAVAYVVVFSNRSATFTGAAVASVVLALLVGWNRWLGLHVALDAADDAAYLAVCAFARDHTPTDAVFLVPPNEQLMRLHGRRAVVVNFKNVPQLATEMREWRDRLEAVLDRPLSDLPRRFDLAHAAMARRYEEVPTERLVAVARRYNARYLLATAPRPTLRPVFVNGRYHLYDLDDVTDGVRAEGATDVDAEQLKRRLLTARNLRVGDETLQYIRSQLAARRRPFPVLARDARTGMPRRDQIDPAALTGAAGGETPLFPEF